MGKTPGLFLDPIQNQFIFLSIMTILFSENLQICLQNSKGSAKLMGCICGKLLLNFKRVGKPHQHIIKGTGKLCNFIIGNGNCQWF